MLEYPLILLPEALQQVNPPTIPKPVKPVYSVEPSKPRPLPPPPQPVNIQRFIIHSLTATLMIIIIGGMLSLVNPQLAGGFSFLLLLSFSSFILVRTLVEKQSFNQRQRHYEELQQRYLLQLESYSRKLAEFEQHQLSYSQNMKTYQVNLKEWQENIQEFRVFLTETLKDAQSYSIIDPMSPKSYAEKRFFFVLQKYFSPHLHTGVKVQNSGENSENDYLLDFAYLDQEIKLYIDIEIDEPYHFKTREITHYLEREEEAKRHHFLLENYWIIIRFSEEQAVKFPQSCCKTIAEVIYQITGDDTIISQLNSEPDLPVSNRWNKEEALMMEQQNYRQTYLH